MKNDQKNTAELQTQTDEGISVREWTDKDDTLHVEMTLEIPIESTEESSKKED